MAAMMMTEIVEEEVKVKRKGRGRKEKASWFIRVLAFLFD